VVVIGGGMAGLSAAIWARRLGLSVVVLERAQRPGGQLLELTAPIIDYPGVPRTPGPALAEIVYRQALDLGARILTETPVQRIDPLQRICHTPRGPFAGRAVILATGVRPRRLGVPGEADLYAAGLVQRPSQNLSWFRHRRVAVVGGGDRAVENALLLAPVASEVVLIHRRSRLRARETLVRQLRKESGIRLLLETQVTAFSIRRNAEGLPAGANLHLIRPDGEAGLLADAVCIYIGNEPVIDLLKGLAAETPEGGLQTDSYGRTSLPGIWAVGDVHLPPAHQSLATCAGQAMVAVKEIALELQSCPP